MLTPAKAELARRLEIRASFLAWCREAGYEPAAHHLVIIHELELLVENLFKALLRGHEVPEELLRLLVMTPPGSAKSTYISKLFPAWFLAQCQRLETLMLRAQKRFEPLGILACTHNGDLCNEFGAASRNLVTANERWLGYALKKDSRAADAWSCTNGGYYRGGTVGSGISGRRMHLGLVDDFCGQEADATSKIENEKVWVWWQNDFVNRLQPVAARVIICNHRNEDDLAGRLLAREADKWRIVRLRLVIETEEQAEQDPMHRKVGEHLWPEYFTKEQVAERMANPRASGIQQQEPSPEKGAFFTKENIEANEYERTTLPRLVEAGCYGASDHAVRTNQQNDCSCLGLGLFQRGVLYVHPDLKWDRMPADVQVNEMLRYAREYAPLAWWAEKENISGAIGPFLRARMLDEQTFMSVTEVPHKNKDLMARAQTAKAMVDMGLVKFPRWAPWWARAKKELLVFPNGAHDDFVSFLAHLCRGVNKMASPVLAKVENKVTTVEAIVNPLPGFNITAGDLRRQREVQKRKDILLSYA